MKIRVKLFAMLRERAGAGEVALDLPAGATVAMAVEALAQAYPSLDLGRMRAAYAVNLAYASQQTALSDGDELAVLPPVSGG